MYEHENRRRIDEELVCADCLANCLKETVGCQCVNVAPVEDDPPDFWFTIDGQRFAVEVTSIVARQHLRASYQNLAETIASAAKQQEAMKGRFALVVHGDPRPPRQALKKGKDMVQKATDFVVSALNQGSTDELLLWSDRHGLLSIRKLSSNEASIGVIHVETPKWEAETREELCELMQERLDAKHQRLEEKRNTEHNNTILVFYDATGAEVSSAQQALLETEGYDWFHSVFWAASFTDRPNELWPGDPGRKGQFLYSENEVWWKASRSSN